MKLEKFSPSERLSIPNSLCRRSAQQAVKTLSSTFPLRVHVLPLDCNRFGYGQPGGGGFGFAIDSDSTLRTTLSSDNVYEGPPTYAPIVDRACAIAGAISGGPVFLDTTLSLDAVCSPHVGVGSHGVLLTVLLAHLNRHIGLGLTQDDIRMLVASNFIEVAGTECVLGLETGLASACVLHGGFNLVADRVHLVWNHMPPSFPAVFLCMLPVDRPSFDGSEDDHMLQRSLLEDQRDRGHRAYCVLMDMIPSLVEGNLVELGKAVWDIQFSGTHLSMVQRYNCTGSRIYDFLCSAKDAGIEVVGLSSVGPACFVVGSEERNVESFLQSTGYVYFRRQLGEPIAFTEQGGGA